MLSSFVARNDLRGLGQLLRSQATNQVRVVEIEQAENRELEETVMQFDLLRIKKFTRQIMMRAEKNKKEKNAGYFVSYVRLYVGRDVNSNELFFVMSLNENEDAVYMSFRKEGRYIGRRFAMYEPRLRGYCYGVSVLHSDEEFIPLKRTFLDHSPDSIPSN